MFYNGEIPERTGKSISKDMTLKNSTFNEIFQTQRVVKMMNMKCLN